jgi:hypothetical protein
VGAPKLGAAPVSEKRVGLNRSPRPPGLWALNAFGSLAGALSGHSGRRLEAIRHAVAEFLKWCGVQGVLSIADVLPLNAESWIEAPVAYEHDVAWHAARRGDEVLERRWVNHPDGAGSGEYFRNDPWRGN